MPKIDLHVHSTRSDGTLTPSELVYHAKELGISAFALTDHDTTEGLDEAVHTGLREGIDVVPGIEFSTEYQGKDIHILGYCFDYAAEGLTKRVREFADARDARNKKMCALLQSDGINVPYEALIRDNPGAVITRAQIGRYMFEHGITSSIAEAFEKYIGDDCRYFVPREKISPQMAVKFILDYHGVPVLAHPYQYKLTPSGLDALIALLTKEGLMGLECLYSKYSPAETRELEKLADQYGLLETGGSDFHGNNKPGLEMGTGYNNQLYVPEHLLTNMRRRLYGTSENTKVFFADLDGTLLDAKKTITPKTREALEKWDKKGNILVLSSGRALADMKMVADELHLNQLSHLYLEAFNGSLLYDCRNKMVLYREGVPLDIVNDIFDECEKYGEYVHTYTDTGIAVRVYRKETKFYQRFHRMKVIEAGLSAKKAALYPLSPEDLEARDEYFKDPENRKGASIRGAFIEDFRENPAGGDMTKVLSAGPCKCIAIEMKNPAAIDRLREALAERYHGTLEVFMSSEYYLEIVSSFAGKGRGLLRFAAGLGIPVKNTFAAGDSENDISMIEAAGTGIAMKNGIEATPRLKDAADIITDEDNDHDGLASILEKNA